jgi:fluoride exporter
MPAWFLVGAGGALGAMARHALNHVVHQRSLASVFPLGIFVINVLGSIAIGLVAGWLASGRLHWGYSARTFVIVGVLGGFTTFSSFSLDTLALFRDGHVAMALWNVAGQVGLSLIGVWVGFRLGHL